ncbi:hypothetical protein AMTR_s00013p00219210 [Amborella trichopoda]|uniref:Uncharacterized protein n=1 Tax=Amborella trichopoda TaxID=13333 RepID=W1PPI2_AMBTC|nr:hypothetical protein AMTR_s00013p00219210 [Amborella trichopoda]
MVFQGVLVNPLSEPDGLTDLPILRDVAKGKASMMIESSSSPTPTLPLADKTCWSGEVDNVPASTTIRFDNLLLHGSQSISTVYLESQQGPTTCMTLSSAMEAQSVAIMDARNQDILLHDPDAIPILPHEAIKKNFSQWELEVNWGHLYVKVPSQNATLKHLPHALILASFPGTPPILVIESSSSEEDLSPRSHN